MRSIKWMLAKCRKCKQVAIWYYIPADCASKKKDRYYCEDCVPRGCSCQLIYKEENGVEVASDEQYRDEQNRLLPCIEYDYSADGFDTGPKAWIYYVYCYIIAICQYRFQEVKRQFTK